MSQHTKKVETTPHNKHVWNFIDDVKVIDHSYLTKSFKAQDQINQNFIDSTVQDFGLNKEQERAFRIIANHASDDSGEQLKMYLGGMGGTGKSQVIKALIKFF